MDRQLIKHTLKQIIHLTPARQAEVCYRVNISDHSANQIAVRIEPTLDHLTWTRIGDKNRTQLYDSMVFHTGLAVGNITAWLDCENITYVTTHHLPDEPATQCANTSRTMWGNSDYLAHELSAWIELQRIGRVGVFDGYQYDSTKCYRDCKFVLKAMCEDIDYLSNDHVVNCLHEYFDKGGQPLIRQSVEVEAYRFLRSLIVDSVLTHTAPVDSYQAHTPRRPVQLPIEAEGRQHVDYLMGVIIHVLGNGPSAIPAPLNSVPRTQDHVEVIVNA